MAIHALLNQMEFASEQATILAPPLSCKVVRGATHIRAAIAGLRSLRIGTGQQDEVTTDPEWFADMAVARGNIPWIVQLSEGKKVVAAILLSERCVLGLPSGYLKADGGFGEEFLICPAHLRATYLPLLLEGVFAHRGVLIAHVPQRAEAETAFTTLPEDAGIDMEWKDRKSHYRLPLRESMEETLAPYGVRTRRNLRYYLRKSRLEGCSFVEGLNRAERLDAVKCLVHDATHRQPLEAVLRREETLQATPGSFAVGLRAPDGSWLSYLAGWRDAQRTNVYWQMNRVVAGSSSVSTALRAYLMEIEIARGCSEIVFVGGTSSVFMRCCEQDLCVDLIARRRGLRSGALSRFLSWRLPEGHPLRFR